MHSGLLDVQLDIQQKNPIKCKIVAGILSVEGWQAVEPVDELPDLLHHLVLGETLFHSMLFADPFGVFC